MGLWFCTVHWALRPHTPGHGSPHFWRMHACERGHSSLVTHSGRQPEKGSPRGKPGRHTHCATPPASRQSAFGPHGFGKQGYGVGGRVTGSCGGGIGRHDVNGSPS